jgi:hypothetical protein
MRVGPFQTLLLLLLFLLAQGCSSADRVLAPPKSALFQCEPMNRVTGATSPTADIVLQGGNPASEHVTGVTGIPSPRFSDDGGGCPVSDSTTPGIDLTYIGNAHNYPNGSYPVEFYGQPFTFDDVAGSWNSYSTCPDVLTNVRFTTTINGNIETFQSVGQAHWIGEVPILSDNFVRARYQLPFDNVYSQDGRYYISGGTVKVVCIHADWAFNIGAVFGEMDVGAYRVYGFEGSWHQSIISSWNPTSGWTVYNSSSGYSNGSANGWAQALSNYLNGQGCSPYWDIWVDGRKVCENGIAQT